MSCSPFYLVVSFKIRAGDSLLRTQPSLQQCRSNNKRLKRGGRVMESGEDPRVQGQEVLPNAGYGLFRLGREGDVGRQRQMDVVGVREPVRQRVPSAGVGRRLIKRSKYLLIVLRTYYIFLVYFIRLLHLATSTRSEKRRPTITVQAEHFKQQLT